MPSFDLDSQSKSRGNNAHYVHTLTGRCGTRKGSLIVLAGVVFPATENKPASKCEKKGTVMILIN
jgi:hypothetical protein